MTTSPTATPSMLEPGMIHDIAKAGTETATLLIDFFENLFTQDWGPITWTFTNSTKIPLQAYNCALWNGTHLRLANDQDHLSQQLVGPGEELVFATEMPSGPGVGNGTGGGLLFFSQEPVDFNGSGSSLGLMVFIAAGNARGSHSISMQISAFPWSLWTTHFINNDTNRQAWVRKLFHSCDPKDLWGTPKDGLQRLHVNPTAPPFVGHGTYAMVDKDVSGKELDNPGNEALASFLIEMQS